MLKKIFNVFKKIAKKSFLGLLILVSMVLMSNIWITQSTKKQIFDSVEAIPINDVGLVLGTSKRTRRNTVNYYFKNRMEAAAKLYHAGKIKHILVSGDNHTIYYDEATDMKNYLIQLGIPANKITLDYAGFRTLDSVVRAKKVFGQKKLTIISQNFHNQRAVFLANKNKIDAIAFDAKEVSSNIDKKTKFREYLAKFKAVLDIYVLFTKPKFLGKKIDITV